MPCLDRFAQGVGSGLNSLSLTEEQGAVRLNRLQSGKARGKVPVCPFRPCFVLKERARRGGVFRKKRIRAGGKRRGGFDIGRLTERRIPLP